MRPHRRLLRGAALIRPGRDDDAARYISLIGRCWSDYPNCPLDVDGEAPELRHLATHYAEADGALWIAGAGVGMIATRPLRSGRWEICRVYVMPDRHGSGLGRELLETAEAHAARSGATGYELWTDTRFSRAHRFYEKHGYSKQPETRELHDLGQSVEFLYWKEALRPSPTPHPA